MTKGNRLIKNIVCICLMMAIIPLFGFSRGNMDWNQHPNESQGGYATYPPVSGEDYEYFYDAEGQLYYTEAKAISPYGSSTGTSSSVSYPTATPVVTATPAPAANSNSNSVAVNLSDASMTGEKFDGTGTVLDHTADLEKEFYTIKTADGKVFYMIIDHSKTGNNAYFLREINEEDLTIISEAAYSQLQSQINGINNQQPVAEPLPAKQSSSTGWLFPLLLVVAGVGGWYYFNNKDKFSKKKKENQEEELVDALETDAELDEEYIEDEELMNA